MATTNNGHLINDKSATLAEALAGLADDTTITPEALAYVLANSTLVLDQASETEALAGTSTTKAISPETLNKVLISGSATPTVAGTVRIATNAEAVAMASGSRALAPSNLPSVLGWSKCYIAALTQSGTNAPTATELINTIGGSITWAYIGTGSYSGSLSSAFPAGKTVLVGDKLTIGVSQIELSRIDVGTLHIMAYDMTTWAIPALADALLTSHMIMIFICP